MRINQNISALNAYRNLVGTDNQLNKNLERLSSGLRINRASDDAAGLAISEKMRSQVRGLNQAVRNAQDGISLIQTAEGALTESHNILQRMRELAVQAANDTLAADDRLKIQNEITELLEELNRIAESTQFNGKYLLNGEVGKLATATGVGDIINVKVTDDTVLGTYNITGSTLATAAVTTQNVDLASGGDPGTVEIGAASTITINGESFIFDATDTFADVQQAILARLNNVDVEIGEWDDAGTAKVSISISSIDVGSDASLVIDDLGGIFSGAAVVAGQDATLAGAPGTYEATGNEVVFTDGDLKGLEFTLNREGAFELTVAGDSLSFQIGPNEGQTMTMSIGSMTVAALGVESVSVTTTADASAAITTIDAAVISVSEERSKLGAYQNRLEHTIANLGAAAENLAAAESRIRGVDMAEETMAFTKNQILMQAGTAMLAQANIKPQSVLQLLA